MERGDRPALASFVVAGVFGAGRFVELDDDAAQHVRVRRFESGDRLRLTNGIGSVALGSIDRLTKRTVRVIVDEVIQLPPLPDLRLFVPVADRDRMLWLAEKATEIGIRVWQPVSFRRSTSVSPRGEGDAFARRVHARMCAALEQSGGAWLPEIRHAQPLPELLRDQAAVSRFRFLLDGNGTPLIGRSVEESASVMIGPEGGLEPDERALVCQEHGWLAVSLGANTLRFETAGVIAAGMVRAQIASTT